MYFCYFIISKTLANIGLSSVWVFSSCFNRVYPPKNLAGFSGICLGVLTVHNAALILSSLSNDCFHWSFEDC